MKKEYKNKLKLYFLLTKPGIIIGNVITAAAGFFFASHGNINLWLLLAALGGTSLVIASACVFNNWLDRDIDRKMDRTRNRALVTGVIPVPFALIYASLLGVIGFAILVLWVNLITALLGLLGFIFYVIFYGLSKRQSIYGTLVGSVSGATPIAAGYTAVTGNFDIGALLLFIILVIWQMPHFYAIAIYRLTDYKNASIPVLPAVQGILVTKIHIILYIAAFLFSTFLLTMYGFTGYIFAAIMVIAGLIWLVLAMEGLRAPNDTIWAKKMFKFSLNVIMAFCIIISLDTFLK